MCEYFITYLLQMVLIEVEYIVLAAKMNTSRSTMLLMVLVILLSIVCLAGKKS